MSWRPEPIGKGGASASVTTVVDPSFEEWAQDANEAQTWIAKRTEVATAFVELATAQGVDPADPRVAAFDAPGTELADMSTDLGLMYCVGGAQ